MKSLDNPVDMYSSCSRSVLVVVVDDGSDDIIGSSHEDETSLLFRFILFSFFGCRSENYSHQICWFEGLWGLLAGKNLFLLVAGRGTLSTTSHHSRYHLQLIVTVFFLPLFSSPA